MDFVSYCKYPYPCIALLHCSLLTSLFLPIIVGCGEDDSKAVEVVQIIPEAGTRQTPTVIKSPTQKFLVRFDQPIISNSGSITFGNWTFQPDATDRTDTLTWNRCFRPLEMPENLVPLIIHNFQSVDGETQRERFEGWYKMYSVDFDITFPEVIEYHPTGQDVEPESIKEIRVVFDRPMGQVEFEIVPFIDGTAQFNNNDIQCIGVASWVFVDTEQLHYATDYRIVLKASDVMGQHVEIGLDFSSRAKR